MNGAVVLHSWTSSSSRGSTSSTRWTQLLTGWRSGSGQAAEAPHRVRRKPRRDRGVRTVAQQAQRDVHPDLGPAPGEQSPAPAKVRAGLAPRMVERGAVGTELVVEGVDHPVALLADVT